VWLRIGAYFYPRGGMPIDVFWQSAPPPAGLCGARPGRCPLSGPRMNRCFALLAATLAVTTSAHGQSPIMQAVQAKDFTAADALSRAVADRSPRNWCVICAFSRRNRPARRSSATFIAANPTWPQQRLLQTRLSDATARIPDDAAARAVCEAYVPHNDTAWFAVPLPNAPPATRQRRRTWHAEAWLAGITGADTEAAFLQQWESAIDARNAMAALRCAGLAE